MISMGGTPGWTNGSVRGRAPVSPFSTMLLYPVGPAAVEIVLHGELVLYVPVPPFFGWGPPQELPSSAAVCSVCKPILRHAGAAPSQPAGAVGKRTAVVRPRKALSAPFCIVSRTMSPTALTLSWKVKVLPSEPTNRFPLV